MSSVNVTFQSSCKYGPSYNTTYSDWVVVDDINVLQLNACSYYIADASVDADASCYGGSDGSATASSTGGAGSYWFNWSNGDTTATTSGLSAGIYSCIVTDSAGCVDTAYVTIVEPLAYLYLQ
jgi:hypothetical protein